jgi:uncharacterized alkaline shock family protein YloU
MGGVQGIGGISSAHGKEISELLSKKGAAKGVKVKVDDSNITIDTYVMVKYGYAVNEVAKKIQSEVADAVESMIGLSVSAINVHVTGIAFDKEK